MTSSVFFFIVLNSTYNTAITARAANIICPAVIDCSTSPDIAAQHAITAAINNATPYDDVPEKPNPSNMSDVISNIDTVTPDVGLFDEPTSPAMYPAIADAINAKSIAKIAIIPDTNRFCDIHQ